MTNDKIDELLRKLDEHSRMYIPEEYGLPMEDEAELQSMRAIVAQWAAAQMPDYRTAMKQAEGEDGIDAATLIRVLNKKVADQQRELARLNESRAEWAAGQSQFPRVPNRIAGDNWIIQPAYLKRVKDAVDAVPEHYSLDMEEIEEVLIAVEKVKP